jgi:hypothetical protein
MQKPDFVTFTGIDARTDIDRVRDLSSRYPIEWGILFSPSRQGREPRYPAMDIIGIAATELHTSVRLSAHICGLFAAKINAGKDLPIDLHGFRRAQINTIAADVDAIADFGKRHSLDVIVQHRTLRFPDDDRVTWLYDCSGGRGEEAKTWPLHPGEGKLFGYAGGLNPGNINAMNDLIKLDEDSPYWLDMESGIRTEDWLDLDKCEAVCKALF